MYKLTCRNTVGWPKCILEFILACQYIYKYTNWHARIQWDGLNVFKSSFLHVSMHKNWHARSTHSTQNPKLWFWLFYNYLCLFSVWHSPTSSTIGRANAYQFPLSSYTYIQAYCMHPIEKWNQWCYHSKMISTI